MLKCLKISISLLASVILLALVIFSDDPKSKPQNYILSITAIILIWYTFETSELKEQMLIQNKLTTMPAVILEIKDRKFYLANHGKTGMNVEISGFDLGEFDSFTFPKILWLAQNESVEVKGKSKDAGEFIEQNLYVYWLGKYGSKFVIKPIIRYDDLMGRHYETLMKVGQGEHEVISIQERKGWNLVGRKKAKWEKLKKK